MKVCKKCFVYGQVQGVFYRASTQEKAKQTGVTGWVKNCSNGTVEVLACGEKENVDMLCNWLWQGPMHAQVAKVECQEKDYTEIKQFQVLL